MAPEAKSNEKEEAKHKRIVARRERLFTLLGALILFVTFIVKDSKREEYKELVAAISNAQVVFGTRDQLLTVLQRVSYTSTQLERLSLYFKHKKSSSQSEAETLADLPESFAAAEDMTETSSVQLTMLQDLVKKVPDAPVDLKQRIEMEKTTADKLNESLELEEGTVAAKTGQSDSDLEPELKLEDFATRINNQMNKSLKLLQSTGQLHDEAMKVVETSRAKSEETLGWYSKGSIVLYILGWSVALCAKLYGSKEMSGAES